MWTFCFSEITFTNFCTIAIVQLYSYVPTGGVTVGGCCLPLTLIDLQLDTQNSYLFIYNTFIKILYMFRTLACSSSGGLRRNCIHMQALVSSLSAGDCPVHRLTHCGRVTQICFFNTVKLGTSANSP